MGEHQKLAAFITQIQPNKLNITSQIDGGVLELSYNGEIANQSAQQFNFNKSDIENLITSISPTAAWQNDCLEIQIENQLNNKIQIYRRVSKKRKARNTYLNKTDNNAAEEETTYHIVINQSVVKKTSEIHQACHFYKSGNRLFFKFNENKQLKKSAIKQLKERNNNQNPQPSVQRRCEADRIRNFPDYKAKQNITMDNKGFYVFKWFNGIPLSNNHVVAYNNPISQIKSSESIIHLYSNLIYEFVSHFDNNRFTHLDISENNVLVEPSGAVSIIDFGSVFNYGDPTLSSYVGGTPGFYAPEYISHERLDLIDKFRKGEVTQDNLKKINYRQAPLYSFGIILAFRLGLIRHEEYNHICSSIKHQGNRAVKNNKIKDKIRKIINKSIDLHRSTGSSKTIEALLDLTEIMLADSPQDRLPYAELLERLDTIKLINAKELYKNVAGEKFDQAHLIAKKILKASTRNNDFRFLLNTITSSLNLIDNNQIIIGYFFNILKLPELSAANKESTKKKIHTLLNHFLNNFNEIDELLTYLTPKKIDELSKENKALSKDKISELAFDFQYMFGKFNNKETSLKNMLRFNDLLLKKKKKWVSLLSEIQSKKIPEAKILTINDSWNIINENEAKNFNKPFSITKWGNKQNDKINQLKSNLNQAINNYKNLHANDSCSFNPLNLLSFFNVCRLFISDQRKDDIDIIKNIMVNYQTDEDEAKLISAVQDRCHSILVYRTGFFGRSQLVNMLNEAIANHINRPQLTQSANP